MDQLNQVERRGMFGGLRVPFDLNMLVLGLGAVLGFRACIALTESMTGDSHVLARVTDRLTGGDLHLLGGAGAGPLQPITWILTGGFFLAFWTFFSTAISRIAAMKIAREETLDLKESARFAARKFMPVLSSVLFVATILLVFYALCNATIAGFAMRVPGLDILVSVLFFTVLLSTFFIVFSLALGVFGMNLAASAIATESSDTWDGISRSWNYILVRPWHVILVYGLTFAYLGVFGFFGGKFLDWSVNSLAIGSWGAGEGVQVVTVAADDLPDLVRKSIGDAKTGTFVRPGRVAYFRNVVSGRWTSDQVSVSLDPNDRKAIEALPAEERAAIRNLNDGMNVAFLVPGTWKVSAGIIWFWLWLAKAVIAAYALQYFFSATTTLYFILRKEVEDEDYGEIVVEEEELEEEAAWEVKEPAKAAAPGATAPAGGLIMPKTMGSASASPSSAPAASAPAPAAAPAPTPAPAAATPPAASGGAASAEAPK